MPCNLIRIIAGRCCARLDDEGNAAIAHRLRRDPSLRRQLAEHESFSKPRERHPFDQQLLGPKALAFRNRLSEETESDATDPRFGASALIGRVGAIVAAFGSTIPASVDPAYHNALGLVEISPERWAANIQALERGVAGGVDAAKARIPSVIEAARDPAGKPVTTKRRHIADLSACLITSHAGDFIGAGVTAGLSQRGDTLAGVVTSTVSVSAFEVSKTGSDVLDEDGNLHSKNRLAAPGRGKAASDETST